MQWGVGIAGVSEPEAVRSEGSQVQAGSPGQGVHGGEWAPVFGHAWESEPPGHPGVLSPTFAAAISARGGGAFPFMLPGRGSYPHSAFTSPLGLPEARVTPATRVQPPAAVLSHG